MEDWAMITLVVVGCIVVLCAIIVLCRRCCAKSQISTGRPYQSSPRPLSDNNACQVNIPSSDEDDIPELDLHGYSKREARDELKYFLRRHYNEYSCGYGGSKVNIITGQGIHSRGRPVIKDMTEEYLQNNYKYSRYWWDDHGGMVTVDFST